MLNEKINLTETAKLETYILNNSKEYNVNKKKPLVLVLPGGGYIFTSDREAEPIALKFNSVGFHSAVLWYTVGDKVKNVPRNALIEAAKAIKYIREHADEWCVDTDKIIVCGFSAGGNLALQIATKWNEEWLINELGTTKDMLKVNLAIPSYPAANANVFESDDKGFAAGLVENPNTANERIFGSTIPSEEEIYNFDVMNFIDDETPPMFIWHTYEDVLTDVTNALNLAVNLQKNKIPFELHIFEKGEHGLALADRTTARKKSHFNSHVKQWFTLCEEWSSEYLED